MALGLLMGITGTNNSDTFRVARGKDPEHNLNMNAWLFVDLC